MKNKKIELLVPAGNLERLKWAFKYGADAVYIGGKDYSLRANANNFSLSEIKEACLYAHRLGKKVYVTVNIIFHEQDIEGLEEYLNKLDEYQVDAIIISDLFIIDLVKKNKLKLKVHLSTQQSTLNSKAMELLKSLGISRVVLAREASKKDISKIALNSEVETEVFIHGAMCTSYSGRCLLSNYFTNRDANRGGCSQVCRFEFSLFKKIMGKYKKIKEPFTMSSKDLSMLKVLPDLIEMGVTSLKIEGRMRSNYYLATVVSIYRKAIDNYYNKTYQYSKKDEKILNRCSNRDSVIHFFNHLPSSKQQYYSGRQEISNQDFLGVVLDYDEKTKEAIISQRNYFEKGDKVTIFGLKTNLDFVIKAIKDEDNKQINVARHPEQIVKIPLSTKVFKDDILRKKI